MSRPVLLLALVLAAAVARCDEARSPVADRPKPQVGDAVHFRGTIGEDVDCKLLRLDDGSVYSLTGRVPVNLRSGQRVCVNGSLAATSGCLTQPSIEVESVGGWSSCP